MPHPVKIAFGTLVLVAAVSPAVVASPAWSQAAAPARPSAVLAQAYSGMFVCEQFAAAPNILHVPLDIMVHDGEIVFARPRFDIEGRHVLGSEIGSGSAAADGTFHLTSAWVAGRFSFDGAYTGQITATGGTMTGTQSWHGPDGKTGKRTCTAAFVVAPKAQEASAEPLR